MKKLYLKFDLQEENGIAILALDGYLDITQTIAFENKLNELCTAERLRCIIDFSKLRSINSSSLGILILRIQDVRLLGGDICIGGCSETVEQVFNTFGFKNVFKFFKTRKEALEYCKALPPK
jgi:anti-anti-sigma factor